MKERSRAVVGILALSLASLASATLAAQSPSLSRSAIGPNDPRETILAVQARCRVSFTATGPAGLSFAFVDRMRGVYLSGALDETGKGRADLSLEKGEYKARFGADPGPARGAAAGTVSLAAVTFRETMGNDPAAWPMVSEGDFRTEKLGDRETFSCWLPADGFRPLEIDVAGRALADVELWKDGQYRVDADFQRSSAGSAKGRPLNRFRTSFNAEKGLYLLKVHGGPPLVWTATNDPATPLYVRSGIKLLPQGSRIEAKVSPFGEDLYRTSGAPYARIWLPAPAEASLRVAGYSPGARASFSGAGSLRGEKDARRSIIASVPDKGLVAVAAEPDTAYVFEAFTDASRAGMFYRPADPDEIKGGMLRIGSVIDDEPGMEPCAIVYIEEGEGAARKTRILAENLPRVGGSSSFSQAANFMNSGVATAFVKLEDMGTYRVIEGKNSTGRGLYRLTPLDEFLYGSGKRRGQNPAPKSGALLTPGYYVLEIEADKLGYLEFAVVKDLGKPADFSSKGLAARKPEFTWTQSPGLREAEASLLLSKAPERQWFASFARFPIESEGGVSVSLEPGRMQEFSVYAEWPMVAQLSGQGLLWTMGGKVVSDGATVPVGETKVSVRNGGKETVTAAFRSLPMPRDVRKPSIQELGEGMDRVEPGKAAFADYERSSSRPYVLKVPRPALYRIETTGRLATSLSLRSAAHGVLFSAERNGGGRNALLQAYLNPGSYVLKAGTIGQSAGRAGLSAREAPSPEQALLAPGAIDRRVLPADEVAIFDFTVKEPGTFSIASIGMGRSFPIRLEDSDGFPVYTGSGSTRLFLNAGGYRLFSLAADAETWRVTLVRLIESASPRRDASGAVILAINQQASGYYRAKNGPDRYRFSVPAPLKASLRLDASLSATLTGASGKRELPPSDRGSLVLAEGEYELSVRPKDPDDELPYSIAIYTSILAPGIPVEGSANDRSESSYEVSVPREGLYELWSLSGVDVACRLMRPDGTLAASSDDRRADWNFQVTAQLSPGTHRLLVSAFSGSGPVELRLDELKPRELARASPGWEGKADVGSEGVRLALDTKAAEGLFDLRASSEAPVDLLLYKGEKLLAEGRNRILIPLRKSSAYVLYARSPVQTQAALSFLKAEEATASAGSRMDFKAGKAYRISNPERLSSRVSSGEGFLFSPAMEAPCEAVGEKAFCSAGTTGWAWAGTAAAAEPETLAPEGAAFYEFDGTDQAFRLSSPDAAVLVTADTNGAFRCGVSASPADKPEPETYSWSAMGVFSEGSAALLPPGAWRVRAWDGEGLPPGELDPPRGAGVSLASFPVDAAKPLSLGDDAVLVVPQGRALSVELPACRLEAILAEGIVIGAWSGKAPLACRSALDGKAIVSLPLQKSTLLVANAGRGAASVRLRAFAAAAESALELKEGKPFESADIPRGGIVLSVVPRDGQVLCVAGEAAEGEFLASTGAFGRLSASGRSGEFDSIPAREGQLVLRSRGGYARAWLASPGKEYEGLVEASSSAPKQIAGSSALSGKAESFRFKVDSPCYVDVSLAGPGVLSLQRDGKPLGTDATGERDDLRVFAYATPGEYRVFARPLAGKALSDSIRVSRIDPVAVNEETGAAARFIAPGESQAFALSVKAKGKIGVAVASDIEGLDASLYSPSQAELGRGPVMFPTLEPGDYVLVVRGTVSGPAEYSLALYGLEGSRQDVPQDVVESFKARAGTPSRSLSIPLGVSGRRARPYVRGGSSGGQMEIRVDDDDGERDYEGDDGDGGDGPYYEDGEGPYGDEGEGAYEEGGGGPYGDEGGYDEGDGYDGEEY